MDALRHQGGAAGRLKSRYTCFERNEFGQRERNFARPTGTPFTPHQNIAGPAMLHTGTPPGHECCTAIASHLPQRLRRIRLRVNGNVPAFEGGPRCRVRFECCIKVLEVLEEFLRGTKLRFVDASRSEKLHDALVVELP